MKLAVQTRHESGQPHTCKPAREKISRYGYCHDLHCQVEKFKNDVRQVEKFKNVVQVLVQYGCLWYTAISLLSSIICVIQICHVVEKSPKNNTAQFRLGLTRIIVQRYPEGDVLSTQVLRIIRALLTPTFHANRSGLLGLKLSSPAHRQWRRQRR